ASEGGLRVPLIIYDPDSAADTTRGTVCDKLVDALMRRPPYALAFSKRTFNRIYAERFNLMFDLGYAYEMMNKEQHGRYVEPRGTTTL
ncbi:MAG: hypothetical protein EBV57_08505, partial [Betaproteobacteria bacterium]|nr:hypothetical protein [Betaproteobacteria bacterium]